MLLDVLDDVFLLNLSLETPERAFDRFALLNLHFSHYNHTPFMGGLSSNLNVLGYHAQTRILGVYPRQGQRNTPLLCRICCQPSSQPITPSGHESSRDRKRCARTRAGAASCRPTERCRISFARRGIRGLPAIARVAAGDPSRREGIAALVDLARQERIDLTIVGPEVPLSLGVVDRFAADGRLIVRPDGGGRAPRVEQGVRESLHGSDTACRRARFAICESAEEALAQMRSGAFGFPVVIKADGLAAGRAS